MDKTYICFFSEIVERNGDLLISKKQYTHMEEKFCMV